jgi:ureidoacrylate peracid hydrolase
VERGAVSVVAATFGDKVVIGRLLELYAHDFSEFTGEGVDEHGVFGYRYLDQYWTDTDRHPFLIKADGQIAGFAFVRSGPPHDMAEFFILRNYRRSGVGIEAARSLFARFPGEWQVRELAANEAATAFWRVAIPVTFTEDYNDKGPVQHFHSAGLEGERTVEAVAKRTVTVDAAPEPLLFDPLKAAVVVVDMQNDFGADEGMFARAGIPIESIKAIVAPIGDVLRAARGAGVAVVYLQMQFEPDLSDTGGPDAPNMIKHLRLRVGERVVAPDGREGRILIKDTWGTEILRELAPESTDLVVPKHRYSGFYETTLDALLRERGIDTLIMTGATTSICVESTIRDAFYRDYRCLVLADCTAEPLGGSEARTNHDASLLNIEALFGWVTNSAAVIEALQTS